MIRSSDFNFSPVVKYDGRPKIFDFTKGYDPDFVRSFPLGIGRYDEKRNGMYMSPLYKDGRNIHIGVDFWMPAGSEVYAFYEGKILFFRDNSNYLDYGPTIITEHLLHGKFIYALYGHLSRKSLNDISEGQLIDTGEKIAELGNEEENGGWIPHLHFQLCIDKPQEPDMPGVVDESNRADALRKYPDPQIVLGKLY